MELSDIYDGIVRLRKPPDDEDQYGFLIEHDRVICESGSYAEYMFKCQVNQIEPLLTEPEFEDCKSRLVRWY